jgi:serine/threonine protein kinase
MVSPLIDLFNSNNNQVYHPIKGQNRNNLLLKSYPFSGYGDNVLKRAVHEIWIYNELRSMSPLVDYFIMSRGKSNTFVMIFKNYETSLLEIVRYRQLANYHWSEAELVMLWKILISNFKQLKNLSICHREIRLGKIFFTSDNRNQPYQFVNLETARKVTKAESNDLLTVVGVDIFAERPMKEKIKSGDELAIYDPFAYDMACFIRVLLSLLNLDPL